MANFKIPQAKEVKRNIPAIDISFLIFTLVFSIVFCVLLTYMCTWGYFTTIAELEEGREYVFNDMIEYIKLPKNTSFMISYIFSALALWGTIGFILSKLIIKVVKYFLNYK